MIDLRINSAIRIQKILEKENASSTNFMIKV
jgi:hypothetical protein